MSQLALTFRVQIKQNSIIRLSYHVAFLVVNLSLIWSWPFYLPEYIRWLMTAVMSLFSIVFIWRSISKPQTWSFSLSSTGRIVCFDVESMSGWLTASSTSFPGVAYLEFNRDLTAEKQSRLVFFDQVTDTDKRRICRVLNQVQYQHSNEAD